MDHHNHDHGSMDGVHGSSTVDPHMGHDMMNHDAMDHSQMVHDSMTHDATNHSMMEHGMKMYFHFSNEATILFHSWTTSTAAGMFGSCMAVIILATLYEGLKVFRERLFHAAEVNKNYQSDKQPVPTDDNHIAIAEPSAKSAQMTMISKDHFVQTLLHIIQIGISYVLMLIFMTYNVWLCLSVVAGAGLGYFLFGWMKMRLLDATEHCH